MLYLNAERRRGASDTATDIFRASLHEFVVVILITLSQDVRDRELCRWFSSHAASPAFILQQTKRRGGSCRGHAVWDAL